MCPKQGLTDLGFLGQMLTDIRVQENPEILADIIERGYQILLSKMYVGNRIGSFFFLAIKNSFYIGAYRRTYMLLMISLQYADIGWARVNKDVTENKKSSCQHCRYF